MIYPEFYSGYINQIKSGTIVENLVSSGDLLSDLIQSIAEADGSRSYGEGKWTIKEVVQHINDTERIFAYRALRFARKDQSPLPGFDQDDYVSVSQANRRKLASLLNEFHILRASSIDLFSNLDPDQLQLSGPASGGDFTVEAIGYIISGHVLHHAQILEERYLNAS